MIVIINGSCGVGKTDVSFELQTRFKRSVMMDGDYIGAVHPFEIYNDERTEYLFRTLLHLITFHRCNGYVDFVVNYVFETPGQLDSLISLLRSEDEKIHSFWLRCDDEVQYERVVKRNTDQYEWELERFRELNRIMAASAQKGFIGIPIDTTGRSIVEVADLLWAHLCRS